MSDTFPNVHDTPETLPFAAATPYGRPSWSGLLQFSLVGIPLKAYPAVRTRDLPSGHLLHADCGHLGKTEPITHSRQHLPPPRQRFAEETTTGMIEQVEHHVVHRTLDQLYRHAEAVVDWDKAVELSPEAERAEFRFQRAISRVRAGQVDNAINEAEELAKNADASTLYNAACVLAVAADRKEESGGSLSKEACAQRAIALLQQAVAKGYTNAEHMKKDDDLKALRGREDFKKLLAQLEKK